MDNKSNTILFSFVIGFIVNIISAYLLSLGKIDLTMVIIIIVGSILFLIITGFQSKLNILENKLSKQDLRIEQLNKELKNQEQLIDIKANIQELKRYLRNGKK